MVEQVARYGTVAQALHWLVAVLVLAMIGLGWYMEDLPLGQRKFDLYQFHKSLGLTVFLLVLLRLAWRLTHRPPPLPASVAPWERGAAHATHGALYLLLLVQPLLGYLQSNAANFPIQWWGLVPIPALLSPNEPLSERLLAAHGVVGTLLAALVALHVGAALRHHFWLKDDVLRRMLPQARR